MKKLLLFCLSLPSIIIAQDVAIHSIQKHIESITQHDYRTEKDTASLNIVANYIESEFKKHTDSLSSQNFTIAGKSYRNIIASFGTEHQKRLIIGAHYDVCGNQPGADDNASGVTGLLELAQLLSSENPKLRIDLVAYTLEEPPFFNTKNMGSYRHAKMLNEQEVDIEGMICLEMIGYFDSSKKSQDYPTNLMRLFYGSKGDYITLISKFGNGKFSRKYIRNFKRTSTIRDKKFKGPAWIPGVDFSDHKNYWAFGYSAVMITDTAFYRNKNYHEKSDVIENLDLESMKKVIESVFLSLSDYLQ